MALVGVDSACDTSSCFCTVVVKASCGRGDSLLQSRSRDRPLLLRVGPLLGQDLAMHHPLQQQHQQRQRQNGGLLVGVVSARRDLVGFLWVQVQEWLVFLDIVRHFW